MVLKLNFFKKYGNFFPILCIFRPFKITTIMRNKYLLLFILSILCYNIYGQGGNLGSAGPMCASSSAFTYNNSCTGTPAQSGINYGCLGSEPNPAWFFIHVDAPGSFNFQMSQVSNAGNPIDVDYICWGPFTLPLASDGTPIMPTPAQLNATTPVGCSYSAAAVENLSFIDNVGDHYYIILITNFNGQCGQITFTQTGGTGQTDCDIVCNTTMSDDGVICPNSVSVVSMTTTVASPSFQWSLNGVPIPGATSSSYPATQPGTYCVHFSAPTCVDQDKCVTLTAPTPAPVTTPPANLAECGPNAIFDLTENSLAFMGLNPVDYEISYHNSQSDAQDTANPIGVPGAYSGTTGEIIWVNIMPMNGGECPTILSFSLAVNSCGNPVQPGDLVECDDASNNNVEIFDMSGQSAVALGANNAADYTLTYHTSLADANGDTGAISPISAYPNVGNPQTIWIRMESNTDSTIFGTTTFQLIVNEMPSATISGSTTICPNATAVITLNGTPGATVTYTVDGGANQTILLNASGTNSVTTPALGVSSTYSLVSAANLTTTCSQAQAGSAVVTVSPLPTATISGTTALCQGAASPVVTFTGAGGIAPYTFTYTINGGASQTVVSVGNTATVSAPTTPAGVFTYALVSVQNAGASGCLQNQSGSAIITVNPLPTASVSGTVAVCQGDASPVVTFTGANGTAPYTFTYTIGAGPSQSVTTTSGNSVTVGVPTTAAGSFAYNLVSVQDNVSCSQAQAGSAVVTVSPLPTATISGTTALCQGAGSAVITFTGANGVAPYTFTYTINGGAQQAVVSVGNTATVNAPTTASGVFTYDLVSVKNAGAAGCLQNQSGSATITVNPLPTALVSGTVAVCRGDASPLVTFTAANGTGPYTFTYNINGGAAQSVTTTSGSVTVGAPTTAGEALSTTWSAYRITSRVPRRRQARPR
jgi:hypothetical protein